MTAGGRVLALIPARGGSKGIPRKNLVRIDGKPLLAYSILQAREATRIDRVIVSTDDEEIAAVARAWGAEVPFLRPAEYAADLSPDIDVFRHTLDWLATHERYEPELMVHLRATGPVRRVALIDEAIDRMLADPAADALRSVTPALQTPYKMWHVGDDGVLTPVLRIDGMPDSQSIPRQMLPRVFWQNGYVDIVRPRTILEKHSMWGDRALAFIVNEPMLELDYPDDIPAIEHALRQLQQGQPLTASRGERDAV